MDKILLSPQKKKVLNVTTDFYKVQFDEAITSLTVNLSKNLYKKIKNYRTICFYDDKHNLKILINIHKIYIIGFDYNNFIIEIKGESL